jgi:Xaa-Pro aminopeptidase
MTMEKYSGTSTMEEVMDRCRKAFCDYSGQELLFSRDFSKEEFSERRKRMAERLPEGAHLLIPGAPPQPSDYASQDATFYYFTGLEVLRSYLLIDSHGHSQVFLPSRDAMDAEPTDRLGYEEADMVRERLMLDEVKPSDQMTAALAKVTTLYLPFAESEGGGVTRFRANGCARQREEDEWDGAEPRHKSLIRKLNERFPEMKVEDASAFVGEMRRVKSPAEIEVLRQAGHLSALITIESMKATRPGMCESHLDAIARYIYAAFGNCGPGYGIIAAAGDRIVNGHYHYNNSTLEDGVVLMDCGPDLRHYSSDIARIWPVSGRYSDWHRKVYGLIVEYHKVLISLIKPGVTPPDLYVEAGEIMLHGCKNNRFSCGDMTDLVEKMIATGTRYYNHCVGLSVHDFVGPWREGTIEEGMVFVVDPMFMFRERSQYIRVEDTIVVTSDGCERLTGAAPIELDEVEELMKQPSALDPENLGIVSGGRE